jgi:hypothetical protein
MKTKNRDKMKTFEITYLNKAGKKKTIDIEGYMEYTAVKRFEKVYTFKKIISVKKVY